MTKLFQIEVNYGVTRYLVNIYGTRIGKIHYRRTFKGKVELCKLEAGSEIHTAVKKKAEDFIAEYKQDRKKSK